MSLSGGLIDTEIWKTQPPIDFIDNTIVADAWEEVTADLSEGKPAKLWRVIIEQTNNGAGAEDLELEMTINGVAYTITMGAMVSGARWYVFLNRNLATGALELIASAVAATMGATGLSVHIAIPFVASTVGLVRVRQTSAVDVVSAQIEVNISWDKKEL